MPDFYDTTELERVAINLFHGWGYNFYRLENLLRADDLMIRAKTTWLLGLARGSIDAAESAYRRAFLPPPSRKAPRHDPDAIKAAQALELMSRAIGALAGQIGALPVPENDRMTQWHREEAPTLLRLRECDLKLVGQAELLRTLLEGRDGVWMAANVAAVTAGTEVIGDTLRERQGMLMHG